MCNRILNRLDGILEVADGHMKAAQAKWSRLTEDDRSGISQQAGSHHARQGALQPAAASGGTGPGALGRCVGDAPIASGTSLVPRVEARETDVASVTIRFHRRRAPGRPLPLERPSDRRWHRERSEQFLAPHAQASASNGRLHSITSSARARSVGGTARPRALAVFRLMTNSNLVGSWIGSSPGLAPFKILSTYSAARRNRSARLAP
jgi:hypothetical protein